MGLINAATTAVTTVVGDQFKEFVTCPTTEKNVLVVRGNVQHGSGNSNPTDGVISNGSKIVVPQGWAMMIVDNGAIREFSAEPGEYIWDSSSEPSVFEGGILKGITDSIKKIGERFTYGGQSARDQRVYYVNLLTITGNKFGSPNPRKITDDRFQIMLDVTFFGQYAFKVVDPVVLVNTVIGANPKDVLTYEEVVGDQLKDGFVGKMSEAISIVLRKNHVPFGDVLMYNTDITNEMNNCLDATWRQNYGLEITDVALADINLTDESAAKYNRLAEAAALSNPAMQAGMIANATGEAMVTAAGNSAGAMTGFMGMGFAQQQAGGVMGAINQSAGQPVQAPVQNAMPEPGTIFGGATTAPQAETNVETPAPQAEAAKFCSNCGSPVTGKFCSNCGTAQE